MKNDLIGSSVLPISNLILREKIVLDGKPDYEKYDHGFYLAAENMESFLEEHITKEEKKSYLLLKEFSKIKKECDIENIIIDEEQYMSSKNYRKKIKNNIFDKKVLRMKNI